MMQAHNFYGQNVQHVQQLHGAQRFQTAQALQRSRIVEDRLSNAIQSLVVHETAHAGSEPAQGLHVEPDGASKLTRSEYETLCDVMLGLTDKAIAKRRNLSARGVQNRLAALFSKVLRGRHSWLRESASMDVYNLRTRLIFEVLRRGLIDSEALASLDNELDNWLTEQFGV
ncbi:response regulator transcription factor [Candidatus Obscuribacterales bacterium]|nr:response regulator transcription factor [Candidatus Obscuribacterales bacterium]